MIQKEVLRLENDHVVVDDRDIPFDYLVINSGSTYLFPFYRYLFSFVFDSPRYQPPFKESRLIGSARGNTLRESYTSIRKAKKISCLHSFPSFSFILVSIHSGCAQVLIEYINIMVIGGGLVGVELAAAVPTLKTVVAAKEVSLHNRRLLGH